MVIRRALVACAATTLVSIVLVGCAANEQGDLPSDLDGTLDGAGSSAQGAAQETWVAHFQRNNAFVTVNYDPSGSGAGRETFLAGGADFAGSDSPLSDEELDGEFASCAPGTQGIDLPVYISPIAIIFNVEGVDNLNLDAATLAAVFKGEIGRWDDPALAVLNEGADLPDAPITAVHRSDDSGTTRNFLDYLRQAAPAVWDEEPADTFPYPGGEAAQGNSGVVSAVTNGRNTIGYADASKAGDLSVVSLRVGDEFVEYTSEAAAAAIDVSPRLPGRADNDFAIDVDRSSTEPGVYPLVLVSYLIVCEQYLDPVAAELVREYAGYVASPQGQADAAASAGSAPISDELAAELTEAIEEIG